VCLWTFSLILNRGMFPFPEVGMRQILANQAIVEILPEVLDLTPAQVGCSLVVLLFYLL
jgi:hypothetical protein